MEREERTALRYVFRDVDLRRTRSELYSRGFLKDGLIIPDYYSGKRNKPNAFVPFYIDFSQYAEKRIPLRFGATRRQIKGNGHNLARLDYVDMFFKRVSLDGFESSWAGEFVDEFFNVSSIGREKVINSYFMRQK